MGFVLVYPVHIPISYFETDFIDYCIGIESIDHIRLKTPYKRSAVAALFPYVLSKPFGIINGIAIASLCCYFAIFTLCVQWLREWSEKSDVYWIGAIVFCSMGPILSLSRMLNFYPEITLVLFFAAYSVQRLMRHCNSVNVVLAGIGIVLSFCIDVRGMVWGLSYLVLSCGVVLKRKNWAKVPLLLSVVGSGWVLGRFSYHSLHSPLSRQLDVRPLYHKLDPNNPLYAPPYDYPAGFIWGRSTVSNLIEEIQFLLSQSTMAVPDAFYSFHAVSSSVQGYWYFWLAVTVVSVFWIFHTSSKRLLPTVLSLLPFLFTYWKLPDVVEPHIRFYAQTMPAIVVLFGIALLELRRKLSSRVVACMGIVLLVFSVMWVPGWGVSRVILNAHVKMAIPESEVVLEENQLHSGYEVHIYTSPMTQQERFLESSWFEYCNTRLAQDGVMVPFYQSLDER